MKRQKTPRNTKGKTNSPEYEAKKSIWNESNGYNSFRLSDSQLELANKIRDNTIVFVEGSAGTGKSLATLHTFVQDYVKDKTKQLIVVRTPVEAGMDKIGALPNDYFAKIEPHFDSTKKLLEQLLSKGKVEADMNHRIHFKIPNYTLGSTFDNALVMLDECFTDKHEFLTPYGWKNVADITLEDKVLQVTESGTSSFVSPSRVINKEYEGTIYKMNTLELAYEVTANHNLCIRDDRTDRTILVKASELPEASYGHYRLAVKHYPCPETKGLSFSIYNIFKHYVDKDWDLSSYTQNGEGNGFITLFSESDKYELICVLHNVISNSYSFRTQASRGRHYDPVYLTYHQSNIDVMQALCTLAGYATVYRLDGDMHTLTIEDKVWSDAANLKSMAVPSQFKGQVYCVTVPSGMVLTRCYNKVHVSGNCQQLSPMILKLILERTGQNSKVVVIGDNTQLYADNRNLRNALKDALPRFFKGYPENPKPKFDSIAYHKFSVDDVMRSDIVKDVIRAYS